MCCIIPELRSLRQENCHDFKARLGYIMSCMLGLGYMRLCLKKLRRRRRRRMEWRETVWQWRSLHLDFGGKTGVLERELTYLRKNRHLTAE